MIVHLLPINQGKTASYSSEGMTQKQIDQLTKRLERQGGRYVIFPQTETMLAWRAAVEPSMLIH